MTVLVLPEGVSRVRWSSFGVGGVGDVVLLDVDRLVVACEWMSVLFDGGDSGGEWRSLRDSLGRLGVSGE